MDLIEQIIIGTMEQFRQKGMKFTMDDIAKQLSISKKTIYTVFSDKESMLMAMVDYLFDGIKAGEKAIMKDPTLSTVEKIRGVLGVMPDGYKNLDFRQLYILRDKYPVIYGKVEDRLRTGWDEVLALMERGMKEGVIKEVKLPIVKMMLEASLEQFFQRDILVKNDISYVDALEQVVNVIVDGIAVH